MPRAKSTMTVKSWTMAGNAIGGPIVPPGIDEQRHRPTMTSPARAAAGRAADQQRDRQAPVKGERRSPSAASSSTAANTSRPRTKRLRTAAKATSRTPRAATLTTGACTPLAPGPGSLVPGPCHFSSPSFLNAAMSAARHRDSDQLWIRPALRILLGIDSARCARAGDLGRFFSPPLVGSIAQAKGRPASFFFGSSSSGLAPPPVSAGRARLRRSQSR